MTDDAFHRKKISAEPDGFMSHVPVMLDEVVEALDPVAGKIIIDGTFGAGGYTRAMLERGCDVFAVDRDSDVLSIAGEFSRNYANRFEFVNGKFSRMDVYCHEAGISVVDGVVLDVGVSSMQIDNPERGFSFRKDGPLDMRMGSAGVTAKEVINQFDGKDLTRIIGIFGEERHAGRISRAIVTQREKKPIEQTLELAWIVEKTLGKNSPGRIHPATRTFQALRIFVNRELEQLAKGLFAAERILKSGGRLVVVTFHSLEDRIVKQFFASRCDGAQGSRHLPAIKKDPPCFIQSTRKVKKADLKEVRINPRARSAKLRWAVRTEAGARKSDFSLFGRPAMFFGQEGLTDA